MPYYNGLPGNHTLAVSGPIAWADIPKFMEQCKADGWQRLAITDTRILASFNEFGQWMHPEVTQ